jgi:protein-disulfide isomerase
MSGEVKMLLGIGGVCAIIIGAAVVFSGSTTQPTSSDKKDALVRTNSNKIEVKDAKVTLVEFGDYQCPACKASQPTVEQIRRDYSGKITFVFRNFPLPQHQNALISSEAAEAAGEQGKYWEMNGILYDRQDEWAELTNPIDKFLSYAKELGLDTTKFKQEIEDKKFEQKIKGDQTDGSTAGVSSTPTFFLNGERLRGGLDYSTWKNKIDALLNN